MSKIASLLASVTLSAFGIGDAIAAPQDDAAKAKWKDASFFDFTMKTIDGVDRSFKDYRGSVVLVVNVASRCGYTPQYAGLEKLHGEFKDKGLIVLGFPCNDFGEQESGTLEEIKAFCSSKYHVTFPMFAKVQTKPGEGQTDLYAFLGAKTGSLPSWNFGKYLVGRDGQPIAYFPSKVAPDAKELREAIEKALATN